ncbi:MAG: ATP-binding protein [Candidatus Acidiferrales bacterium]|jgi:two-component system NtrC family sensor kinase
MTDGLRMRVGAVALAILTIAAVVFAALNFKQREVFPAPDDGVTWLDSPSGVQAWHIAPGSPAEKSGIRTGDYVRTVRGIPIHRATQVTQVLFRAGEWTELTYQIERGNASFDTKLITAHAENPSSLENYLRITGLFYLFIGLFIFARRWNAPRAVHFYLFCLVSFIFYSFHYSGKLNPFDWTIYWGNVVAWLLQPALLVHFAVVFPERRGRVRSKILAIYSIPALLLALHALVAADLIDVFSPIGSRIVLDRIELAYLGVYFLAAALIFALSYRRSATAILRQQLKWVTGGTVAGIAPFFLFYIVPYFFGVVPKPWMKLSVFSLALIPLCFGYAIVRYRLMDVDIIFKRGLAYTFATAAVVAIYFSTVALIGEFFHSAWTTGPVGVVVAIVIAAFLFEPVRDWTQVRLDRFFYRDRLDYRRTLIEFGATLTNEVRLEPLLGSVLDRISQTLLVDRLAIFLEEPAQPGSFVMSRTMGVNAEGPLDLSFLDANRPQFQKNGCLFFESARAAVGETDSVRHTLDQLDLNYFISCRIHDRAAAILGLGKTVDGDYLTSDDLELLLTIGNYVGIAVENARLYNSLEQKATQIERLKDFSENIVESLNIGVLTVDLDDRIESWNPQLVRLLDVPRSQAVARRLEEVLPQDLVGELVSHASDDRVSGIYKFHLRTPTGRLAVVNVSVAPLVGKTGSRIGRLILLDDITQRVHLEEQTLQTEKLTSLGLLAAGVAHEVNTPLAVISNYIQMLAKQLPADDPKQKTIDKIVKQTFRASEIVNNLLNFSRTGAAEFVEVNMNSVLDETLTLVQHPFRMSKVNVVRAFQQTLPPVLGSTTRLQQVFLNLFMNARDAMPTGGMLEVRTSAHNGSVEIEVTDTGSGIPAEQLNRIFDPFFTTKSIGRGTGLGLSVSYGIIKEHAGKIDVRSTPGKGTSFRLEFPVAQKAVHA